MQKRTMIVTLLAVMLLSWMGVVSAEFTPTNTPTAAPTGTIVVTGNANSGAGTLRQAILDAAPGDTIRFNGDMTISHLSDLPPIDFELTIDGGDHNIILRGGTDARSGVVLEDGAIVTLRNLTMEAGTLDFGSNGGAIDATEDNSGTDFAINGDFPKRLTIEDCIFRDNHTTANFTGRTANGGAIAAEGTRLIIRDSQFINNFTNETTNDLFNNGGAIYMRNGHLIIERSTFDNNTARNGGAIWIDGSFQKIDTVLHISDSTFEDNESTKPLVTNFSYEGGGAIYFGPYVRDTWIRNSLFERNVSAARGGALRNRNISTNKPARIENSTFYDNHAENRGGAFELERASLNHVTVRANSSALHAGGIRLTQSSEMRNSIVVDNGIADFRTGPITTPDDCSIYSAAFENTLIGTLDSTFSRCEIGTSAGNLVGVDPQFANFSPANNGGETETLALNSNSPAVGAGNPETCLAVDQRGYVRQGSGCDLGAFEVAPTHRCVTWDGVTQRGTFTAEALHLALAADTGNDIKVAGTCEGATNVGDVLGDTDEEIVAAWIDESITLSGGHTAFDWDRPANVEVNPTVIDALGLGRTVLIAPNETVALSHLILQNGAVLTDTTGFDGAGGVLYTGDNSTVTLDFVTVQRGTANVGGGIYGQGDSTVQIYNSTIRNNDALNRGGGINSADGAIVDVEDSTIYDNVAGANGGGVHATGGSGLLTLTNSTISGNKGARGAGLRIDFPASVVANNVTIATNRASNATFEVGISNTGDMTLTNSIVSDNRDGTGDCATLGGGATTDITFTLIEDGSCGITNGLNGNATGDPGLNVLSPNRAAYEIYKGYTDEAPLASWTHALLETGTARNRGSSVSCEAVDQRDYVRTDGSCDMGAFEFDGAATGSPAVLYAFVDGTTGTTDTDGICEFPSCELRRVLNVANLDPDRNVIRTYAGIYNEPTGLLNLNLDATLGPIEISAPVEIDFIHGTAGSCPDGNDAGQRIIGVRDSSLDSGTTSAFVFTAGADGSSVRGVQFGLFDDAAIVVNGANDISITCNDISQNGGNGVQVLNGQNVTIRNNHIFDNAGLGIKLGAGTAVTENDGVGDGDSGPNGLLNFPTLGNVTEAGVVSGSMPSQAGTYTIDVYENAACDPSGNGEGAIWLGSFDATVSSGGGFSGNVAAVANSMWVSATATDSTGNTSEFSDCFQVGSLPTVVGLAGQRVEIRPNPPLLFLLLTLATLLAFQPTRCGRG